jgi:hypothetical protein
METVVGEFASRLVAVFLRPSSLVVYALVSVALITGLTSRVWLRIEAKLSSPSRSGSA